MLKIKSNRKAGFTLMETLITVVILGIVAAILVPNLIKNQVENANRTKVKKAMASYEKAINYMIIENDIRETEALRELGQDNCQYTREYFKTVKDGSNNCIFKTADRVWWDITDITNPIISLKDEITDSNKAAIRANALNYNADTTSFALVGRFDDLGTLRVNDNAYEQGLTNNLTNQAYMIKLWHFIINNDDFSSKEQFATCKATGADTCTISVNGVNAIYTKASISDYSVNTAYEKDYLCFFSRETKNTVCDYTSKTIPGDYYIKIGEDITEEEVKSEENCATSGLESKEFCLEHGDYYEAQKRKCESQGARLANIAELTSLMNQGIIKGSYWAAEETNPNPGSSYKNPLYAYVVTSTNAGGSGRPWQGYKINNRKYVCIEN